MFRFLRLTDYRTANTSNPNEQGWVAAGWRSAEIGAALAAAVSDMYSRTPSSSVCGLVFFRLWFGLPINVRVLRLSSIAMCTALDVCT